MKITNTSIPTTQRLETTATLPVGRVLDALVGAQRGSNLVELLAGRLKLVAESALPLKQGERVQLRVEGQDAQQRPILKLLSPAQSAATAQLKAILPKQESASLLLAQLSQLAASKPAQQSLQQLLSTLDRLPGRQQVVTPESLKAVLKNSGLFLEAALARGEAPTRDIKAELLRMAQQLQQVKSSLPPASTAATRSSSPPGAPQPGAPQAAPTNAPAAAPAAGASAAATTLPGAASPAAATQPSRGGAAVASTTTSTAPAPPPTTTTAKAATPQQSAPPAATNTAAPGAKAPTAGGGTAPPAANAPAPAAAQTGTAATPPGAQAGAQQTAANPGADGSAARANTAAREAQPLARAALNLSANVSAPQAAATGAGAPPDPARLLGEYLRHHRGAQGVREPLPGQARPLLRGAATPIDAGNIPRLVELLFGQVESALARVESTQLMQVQSRDGQLPQWLFELPVRDNDGVDILKLTVERESRPGRDKPEDRTWHITLSFDFPTTGPVIARITQHAETVDVRFFAASSSTYSWIKKQRDELLSILQHRGINDLSVDLQHGMPEDASAAAGLQSFVDDSA